MIQIDYPLTNYLYTKVDKNKLSFYKRIIESLEDEKRIIALYETGDKLYKDKRKYLTYKDIDWTIKNLHRIYEIEELTSLEIWNKDTIPHNLTIVHMISGYYEGRDYYFNHDNTDVCDIKTDKKVRFSYSDGPSTHTIDLTYEDLLANYKMIDIDYEKPNNILHEHVYKRCGVLND